MILNEIKIHYTGAGTRTIQKIYIVLLDQMEYTYLM